MSKPVHSVNTRAASYCPAILIRKPKGRNWVNPVERKLLYYQVLSIAEEHNETSVLFSCDTPGRQPPILAIFLKSLPNDPMGFSTGHLFMKH